MAAHPRGQTHFSDYSILLAIFQRPVGRGFGGVRNVDGKLEAYSKKTKWRKLLACVLAGFDWQATGLFGKLLQVIGKLEAYSTQLASWKLTPL